MVTTITFNKEAKEQEFNMTKYKNNSNTIEKSSPTYSCHSLYQNTINRDSILQKFSKGYREETYWGNEHPIIEKTKDLNDDEFKRYIEEEVVEKDNDVYWGAEY